MRIPAHSDHMDDLDLEYSAPWCWIPYVDLHMLLDYTSDIRLEDSRVLLRPMVIDDFEHLLPFSLNEPEIWKYSLQQAGGEENLRRYITKALSERTEHNGYPFIVFDKRSEAYAGSSRFYDISSEHQTLSIGYTWYGKEFQGTGLNRHCKFLLLQYAFETLNCSRVEFRADANNARSIAAMRGIGCTVEGILRSNCSSPYGRRDSIVLSILQGEWESKIKAQLLDKMG